MCGIAGFWRRDGRDAGDAVGLLRAMTDAIAHRGPDDSGEWYDLGRRMALGHRRLSIVDLSIDGHQPMISPSGRYAIVFNGEVYNHAELRSHLDAERPHRWRGHSDTEVMLAAVEAWGLEEAVRRFVGMFAFALWDRSEGALHLVRDRVGIKPLFVGFTSDGLLFGSELKSLLRDPGFPREVNRDALRAFVGVNCVPAPLSIWQHAEKILPGTIVTFRGPEREARSTHVYWSAVDVAFSGLADPFVGSDAEAIESLDSTLRNAVSLRMMADVPIGAFLSGGIDSSVVVALMQAQASRPVRTFSIGSDDSEFDEASHALAVARHLGTDHTAFRVTGSDALDVVPDLPAMYDEPFGDSSQIPTFLVSRLAREHVTVSLSGDGGDELFGGYNRHLWVPRLWRRLRWVPRRARAALGRGLVSFSPDQWDRALAQLGSAAPKVRRRGHQVHKLAGIVGGASPDELYTSLTRHWADAEGVVLGGNRSPLTWAAPRSTGDIAHDLMLRDLLGYLPDDILTKVDRASMAVALEARVPILDHRVVALAWRLPLSMKIRAGTGKWILRQVLDRYVPRPLIDRPKTGFGVPIGTWLRGPLRPWAEELLSPRRLRTEGIFDPGPVERAWREHLSGIREREHALWDILMFQAWYGAQAPARGSVA
jgi:asparagine synthase (glutamine-hydrolysing)